MVECLVQDRARGGILASDSKSTQWGSDSGLDLTLLPSELGPVFLSLSEPQLPASLFWSLHGA